MGNKKKSFQGMHPKILPWTWYCITCHNKSESSLGINRQYLLDGEAQDIHFHNSGSNAGNTFASPNYGETGSKPPSVHWWLAKSAGSFLWCPLLLSLHRNKSGITRDQERTKAYFMLLTLSNVFLDLSESPLFQVASTQTQAPRPRRMRQSMRAVSATCASNSISSQELQASGEL